MSEQYDTLGSSEGPYLKSVDGFIIMVTGLSEE